MTSGGYAGQQVNLKTKSGTLINITGATPEELDANIGRMAQVIGGILDLEGQIHSYTPHPAAGNPVLNHTDFKAAPPTMPNNSVRLDDKNNPLPGWVKTCPHGTIQFKSGEKNNKKWEGYFCAAKDASDKCSPQFVNN